MIYIQEEPFVCEEAKGPVEANPFDDSKQVPIAILNGKVVNDDEITEMDILIDGGKIVQVGKDLELPSDTHTLDAADKYILPGINIQKIKQKSFINLFQNVIL